jgi:hypothetical protein
VLVTADRKYQSIAIPDRRLDLVCHRTTANNVPEHIDPAKLTRASAATSRKRDICSSHRISPGPVPRWWSNPSCDKQGREHASRTRERSGTGQELADHLHDAVDIADPDRVITPRNLNEPAL